MARFSGTVDSPHPPEEVWAYISDLRSVAEWDPSVERIDLVAGEPSTAGARYTLRMSFVRNSIELPYRTAAVEPPRRVVFTAETRSVSVRDEAMVEPASDGGSRVTWNADLRLRGPRSLFELPLRLAFSRLGRAARQGLAEELTRPELVSFPPAPA